MKYTADSLERMNEIAYQFVESLKKVPYQATVVGLKGDLGSGKTTFVQDIARQFKITEEVTSPTFIIQKTYPVANNKKFNKLVHIDAYRLDASEELKKIGFEELLKEEDTLILVEWPERVSDMLPKHTHEVLFTFVNDTTREVTYGN